MSDLSEFLETVRADVELADRAPGWVPVEVTGARFSVVTEHAPTMLRMLEAVEEHLAHGEDVISHSAVIYDDLPNMITSLRQAFQDALNNDKGDE